jgi:single-strand DNA-binding protein
MARSVNKVILIGNLGRDAETKFTPSGASVTRFAVATTRNWKDQQSGEWKEETNWTNVTVWRQENLANYLTKGKQVYVEGRLQTRSYEDKDGKKMYATDVIADEVILLGGRGDAPAEGQSFSPSPRRSEGGGGGGTSAPRSRPSPSHEEPPFDMGITDDDVPF